MPFQVFYALSCRCLRTCWLYLRTVRPPSPSPRQVSGASDEMSAVRVNYDRTLTEARSRGLVIASPVCWVHIRLLLGTRLVFFTLLREGETLRIGEAKSLLRLTRSRGLKQHGIKRAHHACRLANLLLSFFMVQKKSLYLFALQLRHQHKSVVSLSKEMVDSRLQTSMSTFASGANMERKSQTHTVSPPPPAMCVLTTMLFIVSFSKAQR